METMFKPVDWCLRANLYEVNIRQYTTEGNFKAFEAHIARLKDMGINVLWFMPITPISKKTRQGTLGSYYACSDYTSTNPEFGSVDDFRSLVTLAHQHGMKVIIDWVANHTGHDHVWLSSHPEYYKKNDRGEFYDSNDWHDVYDLNYYDHQLRRDMIEAMRFWVKECDIDGFRCDMAPLVPLDFWRQAREELDNEKPLFWLAETEQVNYDMVFDCIYGWEWMHKTEAYSQHRIGVSQLMETLDRMRMRFPRCFHLFFTVNHDENSWNGTEYEKYGELALPLAVFSATWTGIPLIYSGQELPNKRRLNFFEKDTIHWSGKYELHDFYKTLLTLNIEHPALISGVEAKYKFFAVNHSSILSYVRYENDRKVLVVLNLGDHDANIDIYDPVLEGHFTEVFSGEKLKTTRHLNVSVPRYGYKVFAD